MKSKVTDWRKSAGHIFALSRFLKPTDCHWADTEYYLKEKKKKAIDRWLAEGIIEECDIEAKATFVYTVAELRDLLKKHGESASGNKGVLIERVLRVARGDVEKRAKSVHLWQCTAEGARIVEEHQAAQETAKPQAMQECLASLLEMDLKKACVAHHEYEQRFERVERFGSGDYQWQAKKLEWIFQSQPKAVGKLTNDEWRQLQAVAALMTLWNLDLGDDGLPEDLFAHDENRQRSVNLILANADYRESIPDDEWTKSATIRFEDYDLDICDACRSLNGKKFALQELPEIPTPGCTNPEGCRCRLETEYDEEDEEDEEEGFSVIEDEGCLELEPLEALKQLKGMLDANLITATEFEEKKKEILARM